MKRTWRSKLKSYYRKLLVNYYGRFLDRYQRCWYCQKPNARKIWSKKLCFLEPCIHADYIYSQGEWRLYEHLQN